MVSVAHYCYSECHHAGQHNETCYYAECLNADYPNVAFCYPESCNAECQSICRLLLCSVS